MEGKTRSHQSLTGKSIRSNTSTVGPLPSISPRFLRTRTPTEETGQKNHCGKMKRLRDETSQTQQEDLSEIEELRIENAEYEIQALSLQSCIDELRAELAAEALLRRCAASDSPEEDEGGSGPNQIPIPEKKDDGVIFVGWGEPDDEFDDSSSSDVNFPKLQPQKTDDADVSKNETSNSNSIPQPPSPPPTQKRSSFSIALDAIARSIPSPFRQRNNTRQSFTISSSPSPDFVPSDSIHSSPSLQTPHRVRRHASLLSVAGERMALLADELKLHSAVASTTTPGEPTTPQSLCRRPTTAPHSAPATTAAPATSSITTTSKKATQTITERAQNTLLSTLLKQQTILERQILDCDRTNRNEIRQLQQQLCKREEIVAILEGEARSAAAKVARLRSTLAQKVREEKHENNTEGSDSSRHNELISAVRRQIYELQKEEKALNDELCSTKQDLNVSQKSSHATEQDLMAANDELIRIQFECHAKGYNGHEVLLDDMSVLTMNTFQTHESSSNHSRGTKCH